MSGPFKALVLATLLNATNVKMQEVEKKSGQTPENWQEQVKAGAKKRD